MGCYGLAPTAVVPASLPRAIRAGQSLDPLPCLLLGQLATDVAWREQSIGTGMLKNALPRCVQDATLIRGRALIVNAVDDEAAEFWRRRGFLTSKGDPMVLARSILDIAASLVLQLHMG